MSITDFSLGFDLQVRSPDFDKVFSSGQRVGECPFAGSGVFIEAPLPSIADTYLGFH